MKAKERHVEGILPSQHLHALGVYVQTCAQIEYYVCSSICIIEGIKPSSDAWYQRHDTLRSMRIGKLVNLLQKSSSLLSDDDDRKRYFGALSEWLSPENVDARHLAIHGRHYPVGKDIWINAQPKS